MKEIPLSLRKDDIAVYTESRKKSTKKLVLLELINTISKVAGYTPLHHYFCMLRMKILEP